MAKTVEYFNEARDFIRLGSCTEKVEIAISRLENPVGLTDDMIVMYQNYLFNTAPKIAYEFIDLNKVTLFPLLVKYRVIKKANILKLTEYAREARKSDILFYLMDIGNQFRTNSRNMDIVKKYTPGKDVLPQQTVDYSRAVQGDIVWLGKPLMPWQVLENKDGRLLLLSEYVLDCIPFEDFYDPFYFSMSYDRTQWRYSSIRRHVNNEFLNNILSEHDMQNIIPVCIDKDDNLHFENRGDLPQDMLFLLSKKETEKYLRTEKSRFAPVTGYAVRSNLYHLFEDYAYWWLRSQGRYGVEKMFVRDGTITSENSLVGGDHYNFLGVRPAMYYKINK